MPPICATGPRTSSTRPGSVSFEANRYSVPFPLIGHTVEVRRQGARLLITHRGHVVAEHDVLPGKYPLRIQPEHGPGAIARTARRVRSTVGDGPVPRPALPEVEIRDLALYEALTNTDSGGYGDGGPPPPVRS